MGILDLLQQMDWQRFFLLAYPRASIYCIEVRGIEDEWGHDGAGVLRHGRDVHPTWVKLSIETLSNTGLGF